jgi:CubicO group peptidase (beta-lactamase class C family)
MIEKILHKLLEALPLGCDTPGLCVVFDAPNLGRQSYQIGVRDTKLNPITEQSNFRIGSITKQFTASSILQLVENRVLRLQNTLRDLFDDFPRYGDAITVHHLLIHSSGLRDYNELLENLSTDQISDKQVLELAKRECEPVFSPGSRYAYSNGGYCILGLIVAAVSGISFEQYLRKNIFSPSGMTNSRLNSSTVIPERVYGFSRKTDGTWHINDQSR